MSRIIWEKWKDPMAPMLKGRDAPYAQREDEWDEDFRSSVATFGFDEQEDEDDGEPRPHNGPCIVGGFGVVPLFESNLPGTIFNFWNGHSTVRLTDDLVEAIERVDGVESIDVFSPYRFRLAVGRAFDEGAVIRAINELVEPPPPAAAPPSPAQKGSPLEALLAKSAPFWAVAFVPPRGHHGVTGRTAEEVEEKLKRFTGADRVTRSWEKE